MYSKNMTEVRCPKCGSKVLVTEETKNTFIICKKCRCELVCNVSKGIKDIKYYEKGTYVVP